MSQYYLINTKNIKTYLYELDQKSPERTLCGLDLLIENIEKNLLHALQNADKLMIEIDHDKKEVTLVGDPLPSASWRIIFAQEKNNESIYRTFLDAINYARQTDG
ncbi:MAG: hypothetical protein WCG98_08230 [bacterium]